MELLAGFIECGAISRFKKVGFYGSFFAKSLASRTCTIVTLWSGRIVHHRNQFDWVGFFGFAFSLIIIIDGVTMEGIGGGGV